MLTLNAKAYLELCKPKVVLLMLLTAGVGMCMASQTLPPLALVIWSLLGIALAASSAAVLNHLIEHKRDSLMRRTERRPLPTGKIQPLHALIFSVILAGLGMIILKFAVNTLTAVLTFGTMIGYAFFYTMVLKRLTSQNIVIGGVAGAAPPLLGWTAMTNHIDPYALLLVLIIFTWTPPHFWALAIYRYDDYKRANLPMLPVTHGIPLTKLAIFLYTILLIAVSLLPYATGMSGEGYGISALILGVIYLYKVTLLLKTSAETPDQKKLQSKMAFQAFYFSIYYLGLLFLALLVDHCLS